MSVPVQSPFRVALECLTRMSVLREMQRALGAQVAQVERCLDDVQPYLTAEERAALAATPTAASAFDTRGTAATPRGAPNSRRRAGAAPAPAPPVERIGAPSEMLSPLLAEILDAHDPSVPSRPATGPWSCWTCGGEVSGPRETYCLRCRAQGRAEIPRGVESTDE